MLVDAKAHRFMSQRSLPKMVRPRLELGQCGVVRHTCTWPACGVETLTSAITRLSSKLSSPTGMSSLLLKVTCL
jgi:hypothetical protein